MTDMELTGPQQMVVDFITKHGQLEASLVKKNGLDSRAANNLVRARVLSLTNGVYRLRAPKKAQPVEDAELVTEAKPTPEDKEAARAAAKKAKAAIRAGMKDATAAGNEAAPEAAEPTKATKKAEGAQPVGWLAKATKAPKAAKPEINPGGLCLCGCGAQVGTRRRFELGHDAKLHSLALRIHRGKADLVELPTAPATIDYLKIAPWMTDEIRASLKL